jgi:UDP-glucuronate 4-epimerase
LQYPRSNQQRGHESGDVPDTWADFKDLVRDTGYAPQTTVEEGVRRFVPWYLDYYGKT